MVPEVEVRIDTRASMRELRSKAHELLRSRFQTIYFNNDPTNIVFPSCEYNNTHVGRQDNARLIDVMGWDVSQYHTYQCQIPSFRSTCPQCTASVLYGIARASRNCPRLSRRRASHYEYRHARHHARGCGFYIFRRRTILAAAPRTVANTRATLNVVRGAVDIKAPASGAHRDASRNAQEDAHTKKRIAPKVRQRTKPNGGC